jgi:hypothetical protein
MASTMQALESMITGTRAFADGGPTGLQTAGSAPDDSAMRELVAMNMKVMKDLSDQLNNGIRADVPWNQTRYEEYLMRRNKAKQISEL